MAEDYKNYEIVQVTEGDWAIRYSDGSIETGYISREDAINHAALIADQNNSNFDAKLAVALGPTTLEEALVVAQNARDAFRTFIGENPTASEESKEQKLNDIVQADARVSEFQSQNLLNLDITSEAGEFQQEAQNTLANLDRIRRDKIHRVTVVRKDPLSTPDDIRQAEDDAFLAETLFEGYQVQAETKLKRLTGNSTAPDTSTGNGGIRDYTNFGGQVMNTSADVSASGFGSVDILRSTLSNDFGSITRNGLSSNSIPTGYGTSSTGGNRVYDTSVGVVSVANAVDQRVKLSPKPSQRSAWLTGVLEPLASTGGLVFPFTPNISLQGNTNYNTLDITHANQDFHIYRNTPSIDISIQGVFTAQNEVEAKYLLAGIHFLRVLTKMHFGQNDSNKGLPPPQVLLDGYGAYMFNGLSVIVKSYDLQLPDAVDYVTVESAGGVSKVPAMLTLTTLVTVQQTPAKARSFNWDSFASGELMQQKGWL